MKTKIKLELNEEPVYPLKYNQISNYGFQFVLLDKNQYLHTPVMCKDYFQDILWSEYLKKNTSNVYGLSWEPGRVDFKRGRLRMAIDGGAVSMAKRVPYLEKFLNAFEDSLGFKRSVVIPTTNTKVLVVDFSKEWTTCGPLISAFTTLIRISGLYTGGDAFEYLSSPMENPPAYMKVEIARLKSTLPKLKSLLAGNTFNFPWEKLSMAMYAHGMGIMNLTDYVKV